MTDAERALHARWSRENLEAYGAELRAAGHPRGELIAIDLELEARPALRKAATERKRALHVAWLGDLGDAVRTKFGFVEEILDHGDVELALLELVAPVMRTCELNGDASRLRALVEVLVAAPRPWLATLELSHFQAPGVAIDSALAANLVAATPNLAKLVFDGHHVCDELSHPNVRHVVLQGHDGVGAVRGTATMPHVTHLELTLHPAQYLEREVPPAELRDGIVNRAAFPALEVLDLSRNEPYDRLLPPNCLAGRIKFFEWLPRIPILPYVRELRVPSLRDDVQRRALEAALAKMPALRRLEIARCYGEDAPVPERPGVQIVVGQRLTWPAANQLRLFDALLFRCGETWHRAELAAAGAICERAQATMSAEQRAAWQHLWSVSARLAGDATTSIAFPTAELRRLLETVHERAGDWSELVALTDAHQAKTIGVRRINGFEPKQRRGAADAPAVASTDRIAEHEAALRSEWNLDRLAVYADDLLELGDPRGELISLDLDARRGITGGHYQRRSELHQLLFGELDEVRSDLGFAIVRASWSGTTEDRMPQILVGHVARYLREVVLGGGHEVVERDLVRIVAEPRPWLRVVRIETMGSYMQHPPIDWAAVARSWPSLEELELAFSEPTPLFAGFVHPRVKTMRITRQTSLVQLGSPWPALTHLDIAFGATHGTPYRLTHAQFPALRVLDLSRNEPQTGHRLDRESRAQGPAAFAHLMACLDTELLARLVHVRVPAPRSDDHVRMLQAMLDRMPALETFEIVRRYPGGPAIELAHGARLVIPAPSPWPALDHIGPAAGVTIEDVSFRLAPAIAAMECSFYERLTDDGRRAWSTLWTLLATAEPAPSIDANVVYTAMAEIAEHDLDIHRWAEALIGALHAPALAGQQVTIRRGNVPEY